MPDDFSKDRLQTLLTHPRAVIRHDVDYDPACAVKMAEFECGLDVRSVYYVRPLECYQNNKAWSFQEIFWYGHELGVHADLCLPREAHVSDKLLRTVAEGTFQMLLDVLPVSRRVSFHAPPIDVYWRSVEGFDHALKPEWRGRYVADSRGVFRLQPEENLDKGVVQLNLHPEWWFWDQETADMWRQVEAAKP